MCLAAIGSTWLSSAAAHDFWMQPERFWLATNERAALTLQVGHGSSQQRSAIPRRRITRFEVLTPGGQVKDLRESMQAPSPRGDVAIGFEANGVHVLILETDAHAHSALPRKRFEEYAAEEGWSVCLRSGVDSRGPDQPISEIYSRAAKALVQVGNTVNQTSQAMARVGLPLEIVLEADPYAQPRPAALPVRVFYENAPLAGALVKLRRLGGLMQSADRTDEFGRAAFAMPASGSWRLSVTWTKPLDASDVADFRTNFSTVTFGFSGLEGA